MEAHAPLPWIIRDCRPEEAETVLTLWRQAEATPGVTDTIEDLARAIVDSPAIVREPNA